MSKPLIWVFLISASIPALAGDLNDKCLRVDLQKVPETLSSTSNPCHSWVSALYSRVVRVGLAGVGSGAIWSRNTPSGTGLIVTARHVTPTRDGSSGYFGDPNDEAHFLPIYVFLSRDKGVRGSSRTNEAVRLLSQPLSTIEEEEPALTLPRNDFVVGAVSSRLLPDAEPRKAPIDINQPFDFSDPMNLTTTSPTFADAHAEEKVILFGFPADFTTKEESFSFSGAMAYSVGFVKSDILAKQLFRLPSGESDIPYDPEVEFLASGRVLNGMSGGGAFNGKGQFLGVVVRADRVTINGIEEFFVRVVRAGFINQTIDEKLGKLSHEQREKILPFLERR